MLTVDDPGGPLRAAPPTPIELEAAYDHCWRIARGHYENFPLGSLLLPRPLRRHVAAIYAFARTLDDLADEGTASTAERLEQLATWEAALEGAFDGRAKHPLLVAVADTATRFSLAADPFWRLIAAFRSDIVFRPFPTFAALRDYCRNSADPVGHLILGLFGYSDGARQALADKICTGLQLANFWQDVAVDAAKGRLYVPTEDLERFGCRAQDLMNGIVTSASRRLMAFQVERARGLLHDGLELALTVDRRLAREVQLFGWAGLEVLSAIEAVDYDVFLRRPTVTGRRKLALVMRALVTRPGAPA